MRRKDTPFERDRGIKGNRKTFMAYCPHGKLVIKDYLPFEHCESCTVKKARTVNIHVEEEHMAFDNIGLGCKTRGTRHAEQIAKSRGLTPIGDADFKSVARSVWSDHPLTRSL